MYFKVRNFLYGYFVWYLQNTNASYASLIFFLVYSYLCAGLQVQEAILEKLIEIIMCWKEYMTIKFDYKVN